MERTWRAQLLRLRIIPLFLSFVISVGCGDCVDLEDFVDIPTPDVSIPPTPDMGAPPDAAPDADNVEDGGRTPKDFGPLFDFGNPPDDMGGELPFELSNIVPSTGPVSGGTQVRIDGTGLEEGSTVYFGLNAANDVTLSGGVLVVRTPPTSAPGTVTVKVVAPDGEIRAIVDGFRYVDALRVESVAPTRVPTTGGVEVEIRGAGFTAPVAVSFSRDSALRVERVSDTLLRAVTPPRQRGLADLRVTTVDDTALVEDALTYYEPLDILSISPASGSTAGGEAIRIEATGVSPDLEVFFGDTPATVTGFDVGGGWVDVVAPAGTTGLVDVFARSAFDATVEADGYYYRADTAPILANISPATGPLSGGNEVVLTGVGLDVAGASFSFGTNAATVVSTSPTRVVVAAPAGAAPGAVPVVFSINGTETTRLTDAYVYLSDLELSGVSPATGSADGGETLVLTGAGFNATTEVLIGGVAAEFTVVSDTEISLVTPASSSGGTVDVTVNGSQLSATLEDGYTYEAPLEIWGFTPVRGSVAGGTYVEVRGRGFSGALSTELSGEVGTNVRRIDQNNLVFYTPPNVEGPAELTVGSDDGRSATGPYTYLYFDPASRFGGATGGPVDGAVNVTVYALGGGPIADAFVMLSTRGDTPFQGFTDANGMITLSGPSLLGAQTTTATAAGYSTATIQTVDAENITLFLNLLNPMGEPGPGEPPPRASIYGDITATGKLADPDDERTFDMAIVKTTQRTPSSGNPAPGSNSIVLGEGRYDIVTRIGDMAIVGLCGTYNEDTEEFTPQLMAVERFVFVSDQERKRVDLECNIPLEATIPFKLVNTAYAPTGPNINRVAIFWDFGFEGVFRSPAEGSSVSDIVVVPGQPRPEDDLADLRYIAIGGSYTGFGTPLTQTRMDQIANIDQLILMPELLDIAEPVEPLPGQRIEGDRLRFQASGPPYPDFWYIALRNDLGIPAYTWILPGTETEAVIPDFPDFSSLPPESRPSPLLPNPLFGVFIGADVRGGHTYEAWSYRDIDTENWGSYSLASWIVGLPLP